MLNLFKKSPALFSLIPFVVIITLSFGQSLQFSLWQDDNALIFKLQHLGEQAGVFGAGPLGLGAYRYIAVPYIPIYQLFGLNVTAFYIWAIFFYFLAMVSVFFLVRQLTKNKLLAILSGSIFAAGFIGSDGILRLFNSIQTSYSVIFVCLTFIFLHRFAATRKASDYILALGFFFIALETAFIRTQYLILPVIIFGLLFLGKKKLLLLLPFLAIYYFIFSQNPDPRTQLLEEFISGILSGQLQYLHGFFGSLGNTILPQPTTEVLFSLASNMSLDYGNRLLFLELIFLVFASLFNFLILKRQNKIIRFVSTLLAILWFIIHAAIFHDSDLIMRHSETVDIPMIFANFIAGLFLIVVSTLWLTIQEGRDRKVKSLLIFLLSWMLFNILAYSIYLPFSPLQSIHRYLVHSLVAYAIFIPIFLYYLWGRKIAIVVAGFIVLTNVFLSVSYQHNFIATKSIPTNKFYQDLKKFMPEIPKGAVLYFDMADDEISEQQFRDFFSVASMPDETAIAIRYEIDRYDLTMTSNFEEFISLLGGKSADLAFSFFYDGGGLKDTTSILRANLKHGRGVNSNGTDFSKKEILTVTPVVLEFALKVESKIAINTSCTRQIPTDQTKLFFDYILSKDEFLKDTKIKTSSQEKYLKSKFLIDANKGTLWRGGRGWWHENEKEEIMLDIGRIKNIGQLLWINGYANSTPTSYIIETSTDGANWYVVNEMIGGGKKDSGILVVDDFKPRPARFIKMTVTRTFDNDSPAIGEIEVVENKYSVIDKIKVKTFESEISCVKDKNELRNLNDFIDKRGVQTNIVWETDKRLDNVVSFLARADVLYHKYSLYLPAGGIGIKDLRIESGEVPTEISIRDIRIIYPDLEGLNRLENAGWKW